MHACYVQASGILACLDYTLAWCFSAGSNVVSVAEHAVMMMLALVRNYIPAYTQVINGEWDVGKIAERAYDLEGKIIGTVGAGRIGQRILKRLQVSLNCPLLNSRQDWIVDCGALVTSWPLLTGHL